MKVHLSALIARDLAALAREVTLYPDDTSLWTPVPGQPNPGGVLAQHVVGNLRHFIGAVLGETGYVRHREAEFTSFLATRDSLVADLSLTAREVAETLQGLEPARLAAPYPLELPTGQPPADLFLLHLATHLAFHLGQVDYHRRAVTGDAASARPMGLPSEPR